MMRWLLSILFWCLLSFENGCEGYNILVFPVHIPTREHFNEFLQTHLNYADHNVSFLIYKSDVKSTHPPPQTVLIEDDVDENPRNELELWEKDSLVGGKRNSVPAGILNKLARRCDKLLQDKNLLRVLRQMKPHILLVDLYGNDICGLALGKKLKTVVAGFLTDRLIEPFAYKIAAPFNPSYISINGAGLEHLSDRLSNLYQYSRKLSFWDDAYFSLAAQSTCKHFKNCVNPNEAYKDLAMVFINGDHIFEHTSRPMPPNVVFLAGLHCQVSTLLPQDMDSVARSYRSGVIYVSLVGALDGSQFPQQIIEVLISSLGSLPYATFWKTSFPPPNDTSHPKNVFMDPAYSTQDVLGHGRTRLFISFCDTNSVISSVYHGVPIICIPVNDDQLLMAKTFVVPRAFGEILTLDQLNSHTLATTVKNIVANKNYRVNARLQGDLLRDKSETPSDRLVFWVEYAIRRNGTSNLKVPAIGMGLFRYFFLDAIALLVFVLGVVTFAAYCVAKVIRLRLVIKEKKINKSD